MNSYNLGGHSGCQIFLMEDDDGQVFVRKISKDVDYNERLEVQSKKQASFSGDPIRAPRVLDHGYTDDGLFFFDMEYVQGVTLAEYIKTMEIGKVKGIVESLVSSIVPNKPITVLESAVPVEEIFRKKLLDLRGKLKDKNNAVINQSLDLLERHDWHKLTNSQCHGDMTLENIIVKDDRLYFIDFLDSFYDSCFASKVISEGIRVNGVAPGVTASDMTGVDRNGNMYANWQPSNRFFLPEEVAEVVNFLLSDVSNCISGEIIACDQGRYISHW